MTGNNALAKVVVSIALMSSICPSTDDLGGELCSSNDYLGGELCSSIDDLGGELRSSMESIDDLGGELTLWQHGDEHRLRR
jgi:hypothetical protein